MPPPTTYFPTRNIKDYNDIMKITDISEDNTTSPSSQSSETQTLTSGNKINILPRKSPKRQRNLIKKQEEGNKTSKAKRINFYLPFLYCITLYLLLIKFTL